MPSWGYDPKSRRYRNLDTGRWASHEQILLWALLFAQASGDIVATLGEYVSRGALRVEDWQRLMRDEVKQQHISQYLLGKGGIAQMTPRDWGIIGRELRDQYKFLDGFALSVALGTLSPAQVQARARLYTDAAHALMERGYTEAFGMPPLPQYPGDGNTQCRTKCWCNWEIEELTDADGDLIGWNATWVLDPSKAEVHCEDCPDLARKWNPLFVPAGMSPRKATAWRKALEAGG